LKRQSEDGNNGKPKASAPVGLRDGDLRIEVETFYAPFGGLSPFVRFRDAGMR
jgi:hypothetical protein